VLLFSLLCVRVLTGVSLEELRQATCQDDDSQNDGASSHSACELEDSDSELSLPQQKVQQRCTSVLVITVHVNMIYMLH